MLWFLRLLFITVIVSIVATIGWASSQCALFAIPREVTTHPWFLATLLDAYWAFITFYVWVAWKEPSLAARVLWFIAIILWGNFAMSLYLLIELFRIDRMEQIREMLVTRRPGRVALPAILTTLGIGVYLLGAQHLWA